MASRTATRGSARVYLDGHLSATVDLHSATAIHRRIVFAHTWSGDGVHTIKIVCATNRPLTFGAAVSGGAKNNYDLGILQMMIPPKGKAEGKVIGMGMAKIDPKTGKIEVENYGGQPTRLLNIKEEKP